MKQELAKNLRVTYILINTLISIVCAIVFIIIEGCILIMINSETLKTQEEAILTLPSNLVIGFFLLALIVAVATGIKTIHLFHFFATRDLDKIKKTEEANADSYDTALDLISPAVNYSNTGNILDFIRTGIRETADEFWIELPSADRIFTVFFITPCLVCSLLFGVQIVNAHITYKEIRNQSIESFTKMEQVAREQDFYVSKDIEDHCLHMEFSINDSKKGIEMKLVLNDAGKIDQLKYKVYVDASQNKEESLRYAEEQMARMQDVFLVGKFPEQEFSNLADLPLEFEQKFLEQDEVRVNFGEKWYCSYLRASGDSISIDASI